MKSKVMEDSGRRDAGEKIEKKQKRKKYILLGRYIILMSRIEK